MKKVFVLLFLLFGLWTAYSDGVIDLSGVTGEVVVGDLDPVEEIEFEVLFCQVDNCTERWLELARDSRVRCSLYDLGIDEWKVVLVDKDPITIDDHNAKDAEGLKFISDGSSGLMHNKFCIFNETLVWTGSTNPTFNGMNRNDNNVVIFDSEYLSENFVDEYEELLSGVFGRGEEVKYKRVDTSDGYVVNAFCPEDDCKEIVMKELLGATESIHFMTFSFTDKDIAQVLIDKSENLNVSGVMESKRFGSQYNVYRMLNGTSVDVYGDGNKYTMHHKVFIIDEDTVITGSYNPTKSGDTRNDENLLVIKDQEVAKAYVSEYKRVDMLAQE